MSHKRYRVTAFKIVDPYTLEVSFDDGVKRTINFRPILQGELYGPLLDPAVFEGVRIDHEVQTLVWPNGADFDPDTLHDWPEVEEEFKRMADRWAVAESSEAEP